MSTLSSQQLAAARLLACGRAPAEVAGEIGISRQALWKWRRRADFDAEVFRLHECLTWTAAATLRGATLTPADAVETDELPMASLPGAFFPKGPIA